MRWKKVEALESSDSLWVHQTSLKKVLAQFVAVAVSRRGMKWAIFVNRSTTTIIWVYPSDSGRVVMKSTDIDTHGEGASSKGCNKPYLACWGDLFRWQVSQLRTN
jgi:hypothetical protein